MKKILLITVILTTVMFVAFSQKVTNKNGINLLPEKGEFAIGISATHFLDFLGNLVKINSSMSFSSPAQWNFMDDNNTIYGKYFLDDKTAIRGKVRIASSVYKNNNFVVNDHQPDSTFSNLNVVEDKEKISSNHYVIGACLERRRGKTRFQGYYGAEVLIGLTTGKTKYEFANSFDSTNTTPMTTDFGSPSKGLYDSYPVSSRVTEAKQGATFSFGIRGFVGVEYFIFPKFSVGGEFGWGPSISTTGDSEITIESWDFLNNKVKTETAKMAGDGFFLMDTDNYGGNIFILIHF